MSGNNLCLDCLRNASIGETILLDFALNGKKEMK